MTKMSTKEETCSKNDLTDFIAPLEIDSIFDLTGSNEENYVEAQD